MQWGARAENGRDVPGPNPHQIRPTQVAVWVGPLDLPLPNRGLPKGIGNDK
jgi:hypothetical protein